MSTTTSRCDQIIALIDSCLAEFDGAVTAQRRAADGPETFRQVPSSSSTVALAPAA